MTPHRELEDGTRIYKIQSEEEAKKADAPIGYFFACRDGEMFAGRTEEDAVMYLNRWFTAVRFHKGEKK